MLTIKIGETFSNKRDNHRDITKFTIKDIRVDWNQETDDYSHCSTVLTVSIVPSDTTIPVIKTMSPADFVKLLSQKG